MSLATDLRHAFPAPHPAGHPFILGAIGISVIGLFVGHGLSLLGIGMTLFCLFFLLLLLAIWAARLHMAAIILQALLKILLLIR